MIPEAYVKKEETRHLCLQCGKKVEPESIVLLVQSVSGDYSSTRQVHFDCFVRQNAATIAHLFSKEYRRKLLSDEL